MGHIPANVKMPHDHLLLAWLLPAKRKKQEA